jgi:hypothetical protein
MPGCRWESEDFTSPSIRYEGGGVIYDFKDDLGAKVNWGSGLGSADFNHYAENYGTIDGGYINDITANPRQIVLGVTLFGSTMDQLLDARKKLLDVLSPERFPNLNPVTLQFTRTPAGKPMETREIQAFYNEGLEGNKLGGQTIEQTPLRLTAYDPIFHAPQQEARFMVANIFSAGAGRLLIREPSLRWIALAVNGTVRALKFSDNSKRLYFAGDFTADQFDGGVPALNHAAYYDFETGYPEAPMGGGFNNTIWDMCYSAKWGVAVAGSFTFAANGTTPMRALRFTMRQPIHGRIWYPPRLPIRLLKLARSMAIRSMLLGFSRRSTALPLPLFLNVISIPGHGAR